MILGSFYRCLMLFRPSLAGAFLTLDQIILRLGSIRQFDLIIGQIHLLMRQSVIQTRLAQPLVHQIRLMVRDGCRLIRMVGLLMQLIRLLLRRFRGFIRQPGRIIRLLGLLIQNMLINRRLMVA